MRRTRSTTRKSPLPRLLTGLLALFGLLALGVLGPAAAQAAQSPRALATGLHISNGRLLEGNTVPTAFTLNDSACTSG